MNASRNPSPGFTALFYLVLAPIFAASTVIAQSQSMTATYARNALSLTIPYKTDHPGAGKLTVEILSPEDKVLGRTDRSVGAEKSGGVWKQEIGTAAPLPFDELVWERVCYRFQPDGDAAAALTETQAVSAILRRPVVRILVQRSYLAGAPAAMRVIVLDTAGNEIPGSNTVRIELAASGQAPLALFSGKLDHGGTTETGFRFPAGLTGDYALHLRSRDNRYRSPCTVRGHRQVGSTPQHAGSFGGH